MGFSFDLCARNQGSAPLSATKTGTTIAGLIFKVTIQPFFLIPTPSRTA